MLFKLFFLFVIFPLMELALLIKIGTMIGVINTIAIIVFTALTGAYMVKMEGIGVLSRFQESLNKGIFPAEELFDGALILIAGALLITPGVLTDIIGFLFVFPPSRGIIKAWIRRYMEKKIASGGIHISFRGF